MSLFELNESDADDGVVDEQYTTHLRETHPFNALALFGFGVS